MNQKVYIAESISFNLVESEAQAVYKLMKRNRFEENSEGIKKFLLSKAFNKASQKESLQEDLIEKGVQFINENPEVAQHIRNIANLTMQRIFRPK